MMPKLSRDHIRLGLDDLGAEAVAVGKIIDLCIYGGSCLMLVSNFRQASADVDGVAMTDQRFVDAAAGRIAAKRSWPVDWLDDGVRTFLSPNVDHPEHHIPVGTYPLEAQPGLRVYVPTAEYRLAMKLMSMRIDALGRPKDLDDIVALMNVVEIRSKGDLVALASSFYPEARVGAKLLLAADRLIREASERAGSGDEAPTYADRGG